MWKISVISVCKDDLPNLISRRQFNVRRKLTARLAEEIRKDVVVAIDGTEDVFWSEKLASPNLGIQKVPKAYWNHILPTQR